MLLLLAPLLPTMVALLLHLLPVVLPLRWILAQCPQSRAAALRVGKGAPWLSGPAEEDWRVLGTRPRPTSCARLHKLDAARPQSSQWHRCGPLVLPSYHSGLDKCSARPWSMLHLSLELNKEPTGSKPAVL